MDVEQFWELMDLTRQESGGDPSQQYDLLIRALVEMSVQDIIDYYHIYYALARSATTTDLNNAAYIMTSCGDDSFLDFKGWLIAQGKTVYENALRDPNTLANVVSVEDADDCIWDSLSYVAPDAYEKKTGTDEGLRNKTDTDDDIFDSDFDSIPTRNIRFMDPLDEECPKYYPKLWAKFGSMWKESDGDEADQP